LEKQNTIRDSVDFIEQNLTEEISLTHLASRAYIPKFHFHRLFRQMVGESVMQYIRKRRLAEEAGELTLSSLMSPWKLRLRPWSGFFPCPVL
jgi:AraC family transcriptional regulator